MIHYRIFASFDNIVAFTTEKCDGFNNASRFTGDDSGIYLDNRIKLANVIGISPGNLVFPRQTHSGNVAVIHNLPTVELVETDALVTNKPGICICVQTADCVPILLYDQAMNVAGAVHAGWRGTIKGIAMKAVQAMKDHFGTDPVNILAAIGPSISHRVYEVGNEVITDFRSTFRNCDSFISPLPGNKWLLDLWEANRQVLLSAGLLPQNIEILGRCSFLEEDSFYSARRDGQQTGRIVSGIYIRP